MRSFHIFKYFDIPFHFIVLLLRLLFSSLKDNVRIMALLLITIMPMSASAAWVVSADGLSATTSPSPYNNFSNYSTTLSIAGATALTVTIKGRTESRYDFVYITDNAGDTKRYDGRINDTYTVQGGSIDLRFKSDYSVTDAGVTITIADASPPPAPSAFDQKYTTNLKGNLKVIGNTVLRSSDPSSTLSNANLLLSYVNIDGNSDRFNSSSATINTTEAGVDITNAQIKWAGLYWQGYLHNDNADAGIDSVYSFSTNQSAANNGIRNAINSQTILLKVNNSNYASIEPDEVATDIEYNQNNYVSYKYAAFADVTSLLENNAPNATYTVANIPTRSGRTGCTVDKYNYCINTYGNVYDGLGNYGAWSLVIVYDNNTSIAEKTRNITVFDGYTIISAADNPTETINLSGFKTPSIAPNGVDSTLSVFAGEGDRNILGDFATLTNEDGYTYNLPDTSGAGSYFASVIEGVPNRNPFIVNNNGIDIHTTQVGTSAGSNRPIKEDQTKASVTLGTAGDTYMPSMLAFATELFTPKLCYDYDVRIDDHIKIGSENREIHTSSWGSSPLTLTLLIRSEISDFPLTDSKLNVTFSPNSLNYIQDSSRVSPPDSNVYKDIYDLDSAKGQIAIGTGASDSAGGVIGALETTYAKQNFEFLTSRYDGQFDIFVEGKIQFDPSSAPVPYTLSTSAPVDSPNYIGRCDTNPIYDPIWGSFNIERSDSDEGANANNAAYKYPLYTQIVGKDFNISIVSYKVNPATGQYELPLETNATVELEIIDASIFDNFAAAGYDSTCEEPGAIGDGAFVNFAPNGINQSRVDVKIPDDIPNFENDTALQNAAFRLWILTTRDENGTKHIVTHDCNRTAGDTCFNHLYTNRIKPYDPDSFCTSTCETSYDTEQCYACLKEHFASPICSRDNFSIRPESFRISIGDSNESNNTDSTFLTNNGTEKQTDIALAAEYKYTVEINATRYNKTTNAKAYYNESFRSAVNLTDLGDKTKDNVIAALEFNDKSVCNDTTHRSYGFKMQNGVLPDNSYISHNNVGQYSMWMLDSNWTNVDQSTYPYKLHFGACTPNSPDSLCTDCDMSNPSSSERNADGKVGCVINSNISSGSADKINAYTEIPLRFEPYTYEISNILMELPNNSGVLYTNDLNTTNINDRQMAVSFNGPLTATGKLGTPLSNYTESCVAKDVLFDINRTISQNNIIMAENSIMAIDPCDALPTSTKISFQRYNSSTDVNDTLRFSSENSDINSSTAITVLAEQFKDENNGSAYISLDYNFNRPCPLVSNPMDVMFNFKEANSTWAKSSAHMKKEYIPQSMQTINTNATFIYGRVAPSSLNGYTVPRSQTQTTIPFYAEAFCDGNAPDGNPINCTDYNLTITSPTNCDGWWVNTRHDSSMGDGNINSLNDYNSPSPLTITPNSDIPLLNPANVTVSIPRNAARPYVTRIRINTAAWLANCGYECCDPLDPRVNFRGGGGWAGKGNTGLVVDTNASYDDANKRTEW